MNQQGGGAVGARISLGVIGYPEEPINVASVSPHEMAAEARQALSLLPENWWAGDSHTPALPRDETTS